MSCTHIDRHISHLAECHMTALLAIQVENTSQTISKNVYSGINFEFFYSNFIRQKWNNKTEKMRCLSLLNHKTVIWTICVFFNLQFSEKKYFPVYIFFCLFRIIFVKKVRKKIDRMCWRMKTRAYLYGPITVERTIV